MIASIEKDSDGFFIVFYEGKQIAKKKTITQATKALAAFVKGQN